MFDYAVVHNIFMIEDPKVIYLLLRAIHPSQTLVYQVAYKTALCFRYNSPENTTSSDEMSRKQGQCTK